MPRDRGGKDHYDRPSWSEIDKRRGRRQTDEPAAERPAKPPDRWQQKVKDERFASLFTDPKKEAARKLRDAAGKDGFVAALEGYRKEHGLPEEFDLLMSVLESSADVALRVTALEAMEKLVDAQADSTRQVFRTRVKLLAMSAREVALKRAAARIAKARGY